jgi:hypothetical protein
MYEITSNKLFLICGLVVLFLVIGCDEAKDISDGGPSGEPNFVAEGIGENTVTNLFIEIRASRESSDVSGSGTVIINGEVFEIDVIGGPLSTDSDAEPPIPQTDDLLPLDFVCTPKTAQLEVRINPGNFTTTLDLNECEDDNSEIFVEDDVVFNPCNGDQIVDDIEFFNGVCLENPELGVEFGRDTIVLGEFNEMCGTEAPCIVSRDVIIFVPSLNNEIDFDDIIDGF